MILTHVNVLRAGLAAFLFGLASAPALAQLSWSVASQGGRVECHGPDVCALPGPGGTLPIPYPEISASVLNGELRGRARILGGEEAGTLGGSFSFNALVTARLSLARISLASPNVLSELGILGISVSIPNSYAPAPWTVPTHTSIILLSSAHVMSSATAGVACGEGDVGCSNASARSSFFMNSNDHSVGSPQFEAEAGAHWDHQTASADSFETASLAMPFSENFEIGWSFDFDLNARRGGTAELDFSSTLRFTSLRFVATNGFDLTPYMEVSFADGLQIPGMQVASPIPEPETYAMLLAGLGLLGWHARRRELRAAASA